MSTRAHRLLLVLLAAHGSTAVIAQEDAQPPSLNPFSRPAFTAVFGQGGARVFVSTPPTLELRATLVTNGQALANIDGQIVAPGEVYEGHRIVRIEEGRIILLKDGERVLLDLYENPTRSDASRE
jgi:hypothetical protein